MMELFTDLMSGKSSPNIVIIDGNYFNNFKNFVFRLIKELEREIPVIFLDLNIPSETRTAKWLSEIELCYEKPSFHELIPILEKVNKILDLPVCKVKNKNNIKDFRDNKKIVPLKLKTRLTPVNHQLYEYFLKNRRRIVYLDEIAEILKISENDDKNQNKEVYSYVSRFRKSIALTNCQYELVRICKGGYQLVLKN